MAQMPKKKVLQPKGAAEQSPEDGHTVAVGIAGDIDETAKKAAIAIFVKRLLDLAKSWKWKGFNWTALYSYFHDKTSYEQFLQVTQSGHWQSIEALASALVENGHASDKDSAFFFVFSALNSHFLQLNAEEDNTHENYPLLVTMSQAQGEMSFVQPLGSLPANSVVLTSQDINSVMSSLASHFLHNPELSGVTLANTLGSILAVIENELDSSEEESKEEKNIVSSPDPATANQSPTVSTVLSYIAPSYQNQALAILIGFPFDQQPMGASASMMKAEVHLRAVVRRILQSLWHSCTDLQPTLAQLAILVFHFNFLQQPQAGSTQVSDENGFQGYSWEDIQRHASMRYSTTERSGKHMFIRRYMPSQEIHRNHYVRVCQCITNREDCEALRIKMINEGLISVHNEFLPSTTVFSYMSSLYMTVTPRDLMGGAPFVQFLRILLTFPTARNLAMSMLGFIITSSK